MWYNESLRKEGVLRLDTSIFVFNSITLAVKAKKLLRASGIHAKLKKSDSLFGDIGCQYAIEVGSDDYFLAISILKNNNIPYSVMRAD